MSRGNGASLAIFFCFRFQTRSLSIFHCCLSSSWHFFLAPPLIFCLRPKSLPLNTEWQLKSQPLSWAAQKPWRRAPEQPTQAAQTTERRHFHYILIREGGILLLLGNQFSFFLVVFDWFEWVPLIRFDPIQQRQDVRLPDEVLTADTRGTTRRCLNSTSATTTTTTYMDNSVMYSWSGSSSQPKRNGIGPHTHREKGIKHGLTVTSSVVW